MNFKNDACSLRRHQRGVAGELNGVSISLLGVQENGFAANWLISKPQWLSKIASLSSPMLLPPSRFKGTPTLFEVAKRDQRQASVELHFGKSRMAGQRQVEIIDGLMVSIERDERGAAVVAGSHETRLDGERLVVCVKRCVGPTEAQQYIATITVSLSEMRGDR